MPSFWNNSLCIPCDLGWRFWLTEDSYLDAQTGGKALTSHLSCPVPTSSQEWWNGPVPLRCGMNSAQSVSWGDFHKQLVDTSPRVQNDPIQRVPFIALETKNMTELCSNLPRLSFASLKVPLVALLRPRSRSSPISPFCSGINVPLNSVSQNSPHIHLQSVPLGRVRCFRQTLWARYSPILIYWSLWSKEQMKALQLIFCKYKKGFRSACF